MDQSITVFLFTYCDLTTMLKSEIIRSNITDAQSQVHESFSYYTDIIIYGNIWEWEWEYMGIYGHIIILSYAFKMRQDYLSTSYLDQKYLPSERSETSEIWIDQSNVCWDNLVSFWKHMMIFLPHLSLFYRWSWKYDKTCQIWTWMLATLICARVMFSPRRLRASR